MNILIQKLAHAVRKMPSKKLSRLHSLAQWKRVREDTWSKCDHICEICRRRKAMQVHHWTYTSGLAMSTRRIFGACASIATTNCIARYSSRPTTTNCRFLIWKNERPTWLVREQVNAASPCHAGMQSRRLP